MRLLFLAMGLSLIGLFGSSDAYAEDDPMELQRCIWRCLANSNGADDPAYSQCVGDYCDIAESTPQQSEQKPKKKRSSRTAWKPSVQTSHQYNISIKSTDGKFAIELSCSRTAKGNRYYSFLLEGPKRWSLGESGQKTALSIDGRDYVVEIGGIGGGWVVSDTMTDNYVGISRELVDALGNGETLFISGHARGKTPKEATFAIDNGGELARDFPSDCERATS